MVFYRLIPNVKVVVGKKYTILVDTQKELFFKINTSDTLVYKLTNGILISQNDEFFQDLKKKGFLILVDKAFNNIYFDNFDFSCPSIIENIIYEIKKIDIAYIKNIDLINQLENLFVKFIEIRIFGEEFSENEISELLTLFESSLIESIDLYIPFINEINYENLLENFKRLRIIFIFNSIQVSSKARLIHSKETLKNSSCGVINLFYMAPNMKNFFISQSLNSCLYKKISIDGEGNIKNCPSMTESYGNIKDTTLAEAIEKPGFKKYWNINKDQIAVCKDCEFRYICTDCRAYVEAPHDTSGPESTNLSKPLKCGYNPYTGEWTEWSTNPLKQKAIDFYGMREMVESMNISEYESKDMNV